MKTIEERAKEYSLKDFDGYYTGREKAMEEGYIAGATEQKAIDDAECANQVLMGKGDAVKHYKQGLHDAIEKARKWYTSNDKPMSWKEYCKQNPIKAGDSYIDEISFINSIENSRDRDEDDDVNTMPEYLCNAFLAYMKLIQLRNAWVKDGENGDEYEYRKIVYTEEIGFYVVCLGKTGLSFPTSAMAEEFIDTFKDLLEIAKPLL